MATISIKVRLHDPAIRAQIKKEMVAQLRKYKFKNYGYCVVASYSADSTLQWQKHYGNKQTDGAQIKGRSGSRDHYGYGGEKAAHRWCTIA